MRRGFTLIEVVLALGLLALLLSLVQGAYSGAVRSRRLSGQETIRVHEIALVLERMVSELAAAYASEKRRAGTGLVVKADSDASSVLAFTTILPRLPAAKLPGGGAEIRYWLEEDDEGIQRVWRQESRDVDGNLEEGGVPYGLLRGISMFRVLCYDGEQWVEEWDSPNRAAPPLLPVAVAVEVGWRDGEVDRVLRTSTPLYGRSP